MTLVVHPWSATRRFVVPELDGQLVATAGLTEDLLLGFATWYQDEPDMVPFALGPLAATAAGELGQALREADYRPLYAPDGRYEHEPMALVEVADTSVATLGVAVGKLAGVVHRGENPLIADAIVAFAADLWPETTAAALVEAAARLHGVCDLGWGPAQNLLADQLVGPTVDGRIVLTTLEEDAYRQIRDEIVAMWHDFSPLARWAY